jgi:hypothetical protein
MCTGISFIYKYVYERYSPSANDSLLHLEKGAQRVIEEATQHDDIVADSDFVSTLFAHKAFSAVCTNDAHLTREGMVSQVSSATVLAYIYIKIVPSIQFPIVEFDTKFLQTNSLRDCHYKSSIIVLSFLQLRIHKAVVKVKGTSMPFKGFTQPLNLSV